MSGWATALVGVGGTLAGTGVGSYLTAVVDRKRWERDAAQTRKSGAAQVLGRVRTLLTDVHPDRVAFNFNAERTPKELEAAHERWLPLRDELSVLAAADEDPRVTDAAFRLETAVGNTIHWLRWEVQDRLMQSDSSLAHKAAIAQHTRATTLVEIVLGLVHSRDVTELEQKLAATDHHAAEHDDPDDRATT